MTADGRCDQVGRVTPCAPQRFAMVRGHSVFQNPHGAHGVTRPTFRPRLCASERTTPLVRIGELPPLLGESVGVRGNCAFSWSLDFGTFLELGFWDLELFPPCMVL